MRTTPRTWRRWATTPAARSCATPRSAEQGEEFVGKERRCDARQLGVVVRGRDFHDVGADEIETVEPADHLEQLATGHPADLRCTGTRRMRGVEHVDVDRHVQRMVADRLL